MLFSMTGFGTARRSSDAWAVSVEVKTVNNRFLKISTRISDGFPTLENRVEAVLRGVIARGTVNTTVRIRRLAGASDYRLNAVVLAEYLRQLAEIAPDTTHSPDRLLKLPGVVEEISDEEEDKAERIWPLLETTLRAALGDLRLMREVEGRSMRGDLLDNLGRLLEQLTEVERLAPGVSENYRIRLNERIGRIMQERNLPLDPADLVREIALFADRADISEETVRLRSHLKQLREQLDHPKDAGRKLDFLTQELFREVNTIGSKANDAEITKQVVEMKTTVERMREMIQNVE